MRQVNVMFGFEQAMRVPYPRTNHDMHRETYQNRHQKSQTISRFLSTTFLSIILFPKKTIILNFPIAFCQESLSQIQQAVSQLRLPSSPDASVELEMAAVSYNWDAKSLLGKAVASFGGKDATGENPRWFWLTLKWPIWDSNIYKFRSSEGVKS